MCAQAAATEIDRAFGKLDFVINNAGTVGAPGLHFGLGLGEQLEEYASTPQLHGDRMQVQKFSYAFKSGQGALQSQAPRLAYHNHHGKWAT